MKNMHASTHAPARKPPRTHAFFPEFPEFPEYSFFIFFLYFFRIFRNFRNIPDFPEYSEFSEFSEFSGIFRKFPEFFNFTGIFRTFPNFPEYFQNISGFFQEIRKSGNHEKHDFRKYSGNIPDQK